MGYMGVERLKNIISLKKKYNLNICGFYDPKIKTVNKEAISIFLSNLHYVKTVNVGQLGLFKKHQKKAIDILNFIKKEYPNITSTKNE